MPKREPHLEEAYDFPDRAPDEEVSTGLTSDKGATLLCIYYHKNRTYVSPAGEAFNCEPWYYRGKQTAADVLRWYLAAVEEE